MGPERLLSGSVVSLLEIMEAYDPGYLARFMHFVLTIEGRHTEAADAPLDADTRGRLRSVIVPNMNLCIGTGLRASAASLGKALGVLEMESVTYGQVDKLLEEFASRLPDELSGLPFFLLTPEEAVYYKEPRQGWEHVIERFPDSVYDVEEARKCFALERYGAAVFHVLQVVEHGLLELGHFLGVQDPKSGFTAVSRALDKAIAKHYEDRTDFERHTFAFLEQIQATVNAMKNAWRNKISHAQGKLILLTTDFNREVAAEIMAASRGFMRRLSEGLPI
jgi:hypothetical protein